MTYKELWKPVKGYEGFYEVSNTGKVVSVVGRYKSKPRFELKQYVDSKGYCSLDLAVPKLKTFLVHRLVAEAFLEKPEGCNVVNHIDNNPSNNFLSNLEWTTQSGNLIHAQKQNRLFEAQSKGGKTTAAAATKKLFEDTEKLIGQYFGDLLVLGVAKINTYGTVNRPILKCLCTCGKLYEVCKIRLEKEGTSSCKTCSGYKVSIKHSQAIVDKYTNTKMFHWTFSGQSNIDKARNTKDLKLEAVCDCGNRQMLSYPTLHTRKLTCKKCKKHKDIV